MIVTLVPIQDVEAVWPHCNAFMEGCAEYTYGRYTAEDIKNQVIDRNNQFWIAFEDSKVYGAVVTDVVQYPRLKALCMHFTGGIELRKWKQPMLDTLQSFAKDMGCSVIESYGRPGWGKVFERDGYVKRFIGYELPVGDLE